MAKATSKSAKSVKSAPVKKRPSEAERARRKQTFFFLLLSVLVAFSMLISLVKLV